MMYLLGGSSASAQEVAGGSADATAWRAIADMSRPRDCRITVGSRLSSPDTTIETGPWIEVAFEHAREK